jgi:hypothetical protein
MPLAQLLPLLGKLSQIEKLKVIAFLASELAKKENLANLESEENISEDNTFEILHNSDEGARQLAQFLEEQKQPQNA